MSPALGTKSRALRFKPPLIILAIAAAAVGAGLLFFGLPGPCGGGGLLDNVLQDHQGFQEAAALLLVFGGWLLGFLCLVWLVAVLAVRGIERFAAGR